MNLDTTVFLVSQYIDLIMLLTINVGVVYIAVIFFRRIAKV